MSNTKKPTAPKKTTRMAGQNSVAGLNPTMFPANGIAFSKSIEPSVGFLWGVRPDGTLDPVRVNEMTLTGASGAFGNGYANSSMAPKTKADEGADIEAPNPKTIDVAFLPAGSTALRLTYGITIRANALEPHHGAHDEFRQSIVDFVEAYRDAGGFQHLAERYAWNLVNGRSAWRNADVLEDLTTTIRVGDQTFVFDSFDIPLERYPGLDAMPLEFSALADLIAVALSTKSRRSLSIRVEIEGKAVEGSALYPSQAFVQGRKDKSSSDSRETARTLMSRWRSPEEGGRSFRHAIITPQKIGNSTRRIDDWHSKVTRYGTVAVESFGFARDAAIAIRKPGSDDVNVFSSLLMTKTYVEDLRSQNPKITPDMHYLAAMLVRGVVLSAGDAK